jgi:hypothetical protein
MKTGVLWYNQRVKLSEPTGVGSTESALSNSLSVKEKAAMTEQEFTIEELANEEWRSIVGYEHIYSVSNLGRIRRDAGSRNTKEDKILKPDVSLYGYLLVGLSVKSRKKTKAVHRLVAATFLGECPKGMEVDHIKQPKSNNRVTNLEYVTSSVNKIRAHQNGLMHPPYGEKHWNIKIKDSDIPRIFELRASGLSYKKIGVTVGCTASNIGYILRGERRCKAIDKSEAINVKF